MHLIVALLLLTEPSDTVRSVDAAPIVVQASTEVAADMGSIIPAATIQAGQARSMAEALQFAPGVRLEQTCQNCGFTQVRLQGLAGPYTQILIDSRPVFSALNSVYGLEHIPASFISQMTITRGAGSVLLGAGAIAGAVDVITRQPHERAINASTYGGWLDPGTAGSPRDNGLDLAGSWVDSLQRLTLQVLGSVRDRTWYDRNGDGYTEVPSLSLAAGGLRSTAILSELHVLRAEAHWIREHRRGGQITDRPPHESVVAEDLNHAIAGGAVSWDWSNASASWNGSIYTSGLFTQRSSYYGGIGDGIGGGIDDDSSITDDAMRFYGTTVAASAVAGSMARWHTSVEAVPVEILMGSEYRYESVDDRAEAYQRAIAQRVHIGSLFGHVSAESSNGRVRAVAGLRADGIWIDDYHQAVLNPRLSLTYTLYPDLYLRATYGMGFRGPQAFDEDLHISTLQGVPRAIRLSDGLLPERSQSAGLSAIWTSSTVTSKQQLTVDAFATSITNPFVVVLDGADDNLPVIWATKINGPGAYVAGLNVEAQFAQLETYELTVAATVQTSQFTSAVDVVASNDSSTSIAVTEVLRTPAVYGSAVLRWIPAGDWMLDVTTVATGPMQVLQERERVVRTTPWFADVGLQLTKTLRLDTSLLHVSIGVVNIFDQFQHDLDVGPQRDVAYTYGPTRPRTITAKLSYTLADE